MSMTISSSSRSSGIGFAGLLTILFIGLKLTHVIAWSWVWVLAPLWLSFAIVGVFMLLALVLGLIALIAGNR